MTKQRNLASKEKPILKTVTTLAEERGLDPVQLEKEAVANGFGVTVSGVLTIDETRYDDWVADQIRAPKKKQKSSWKKLGDSDSIGLLRANIARLTDYLQGDEDNLKWLEEDISKMPEGIERKIAQKKRKDLLEKIDAKSQLIGDAERRLHYILDRELGDLDKLIFDNIDNDEIMSSTIPSDEDPTKDK